MKIAFRDKSGLSANSLARLKQINSIIEEYHAMGYVMTLRQLYYQLVSRNIIPNQVNEYDKISAMLTKGRMAGIVDWSAIEDRIRVPRIPYWADGVEEGIQDTIDRYRNDRMADQDNYLELWVEKDALSNVLSVKTSHYHINLMVNRGYSSCTAMYDSFNRFGRALIDGKEKVVIMYLGDHDPSGLDMVRDIKTRLVEFLSNSKGFKNEMEIWEQEEIDELVEERFHVRHIALTTPQVKLYEPPPNPAKMSDPRAHDYVAQFGYTSWEVDALNPPTLHEIIETNIQEFIDMERFEAVLEKEKADKIVMNKLIGIRDRADNLKEFLKVQLKEAKTVEHKKLITKFMKQVKAL